jgi:hypothetical protein
MAGQRPVLHQGILGRGVHRYHHYAAGTVTGKHASVADGQIATCIYQQNARTSQKPYRVAISVTVVAVGAAILKSRRTMIIRRASRNCLALIPSCS